MKRFFAQHRDPRGLRIAVAEAFDIPIEAVVEGDLVADTIKSAYRNPSD